MSSETAFFVNWRKGVNIETDQKLNWKKKMLSSLVFCGLLDACIIAMEKQTGIFSSEWNKMAPQQL